jgi:hypothetical protein
MTGRSIKIIRREATGSYDPFGAAIYNEVTEEVQDVLVEPSAPGDVRDIDADMRPDGKTIRYRVHLPKTYVQSHGAFDGTEKLVIDGEVLTIVGQPRPYMAENCPGRWQEAVFCGGSDG